MKKHAWRIEAHRVLAQGEENEWVIVAVVDAKASRLQTGLAKIVIEPQARRDGYSRLGLVFASVKNVLEAKGLQKAAAGGDGGRSWELDIVGLKGSFSSETDLVC